MRSRLFAAAILVAIITAGCTTTATQPHLPSTDQVKQPPVLDHQPVKPPTSPRHGERVAEQSLPSGLSTWKNLTPDLPGGVSAVVGDSLFVVASPGRIGEDAYQMTISDIKVLDKRVQVEAYLTRRTSGVNPGRYYPKDYAKIAYQGSLRELPVELKIIYEDAAYAYVKQGQFDHVDRQLLPMELRNWQGLNASESEESRAAVVGDFLYVMVNPPEQMKNDWLRFQNVAAKDSEVNIQVTYEKVNGQADWSPYSAPVFARIPFQGGNVPTVKAEYKEYQPAK